ncbi:unnamed protein product [Lepeophtheirus salmonis]|uniref:(salmon louse) hypothetical protein n=1 Tax=Lepeophtheirus salmonis TaxID=72036 RepID=A0A7R8CU19_LEPSM|nr:unnamed protein product [Lepeophtheirus salmonis]CAF2931276.1 unnamed protein product [Lepeophtheirus salmonis]
MNKNEDPPTVQRLQKALEGRKDPREVINREPKAKMTTKKVRDLEFIKRVQEIIDKDPSRSLISIAKELHVPGWRQKVNQARPIPFERCGYSIPHDYRFLKNGELFLQYDCGKHDPKRILIFGSEGALEDLASCKDWVCDGTLKCCPENYYKLFT